MQSQPNQLPWYELLRKERLQRSWTQEEVAEKLGVDVKTVRRWERGKGFPFPLHRRGLSKIFEKPLSELGLAEEPLSNKSIPVSTQVGQKLSEESNNLGDLTSVAAIEPQLSNHSSLSQTNVPTHNPVPAPTLALSQAPLSPHTAVPTPAKTSSTQHSWRSPYVLIAGIGFAVVVLLVGVLILRLAFPPNVNLSVHLPAASQGSTTSTQGPTPAGKACSGASKGVSLYTDINYQGICRTFAPGNYDLTKYGLAQKVRSLKDPDGAYHITLLDQSGRPGYFESDTPQLPLHLDRQAVLLRVAPYPPTSCSPTSNGIIGYVAVNYQGGCLAITQSIPDLGTVPFDHIISSLRFVGSFSSTRQVIIYKQPNYQDQCNIYSQDQTDLGNCTGLAASVKVLPYAPPTPVVAATASPTPPPVITCSQDASGVTLFVDPNFQGYCHTFPPGDYDLAQYGLDQNVSSLRDPNAAYHITLIDRLNRPGYFDADQPQLPADWNDQAHSLRVEKHRPTSCNPGTNGIVAYIDRNYQAGCLFITGNIADLTPLNFDHVISSIRFVGSYVNTTQLVIYQQANYQSTCGTYTQDQPDLMNCSDQAVSVQVLPYTPPTPTPTPTPHFPTMLADVENRHTG